MLKLIGRPNCPAAEGHQIEQDTGQVARGKIFKRQTAQLDRRWENKVKEQEVFEVFAE